MGKQVRRKWSNFDNREYNTKRYTGRLWEHYLYGIWSNDKNVLWRDAVYKIGYRIHASNRYPSKVIYR